VKVEPEAPSQYRRRRLCRVALKSVRLAYGSTIAITSDEPMSDDDDTRTVIPAPLAIECFMLSGMATQTTTRLPTHLTM
jgi:hypothetical protein